MPFQLQSEIKIHRTLRHVYVVRFERYFEDSTNVYMLLELCTNNSMSELLKRRKRLSDIETRYYLTQLIGALKYLHDNLVIHRDLKLGNLFVDAQMRIKVGDFGLATRVTDKNERKKTVCGTPNYIAPEILEGKNGHSFEVDVWSTGVILYTLLIGKPPFESKDVKSTYKRILANSFVFPDHIPICEHAKNLIRHVLQTKPESRPSLDEMLEHSYFTRPSAFTPLQLPESALREPPQYSTAHMEQQQQQLEQAASKKAGFSSHPEVHIHVNDENDPNAVNRQHPPTHSLHSLAHPNHQVSKPKTGSFLPEQPSQVRPRTAPSTHNTTGSAGTGPGPLSSVNNNGVKYTHQNQFEEVAPSTSTYRQQSSSNINNSNGGLEGSNHTRSISVTRPMTAGASTSTMAGSVMGGMSNGSSVLLPGVNTNGGGSLSTQSTRLASQGQGLGSQGQGLGPPTLVRSSSRVHSAGPGQGLGGSSQGQGLGGSSSSSMAATTTGAVSSGNFLDKRTRDGFQIYQDSATTTTATATTSSNPFKLAAPVGSGKSSSSNTLTTNSNGETNLHSGLSHHNNNNGNSGERGSTITTRSHSNMTNNVAATNTGSGHGMQPREPSGSY